MKPSESAPISIGNSSYLFRPLLNRYEFFLKDFQSRGRRRSKYINKIVLTAILPRTIGEKRGSDVMPMWRLAVIGLLPSR
jgi:hypothetical protein